MRNQEKAGRTDVESVHCPECSNFQQRESSHRIEQEVQRKLLSHPELQFSSLVVHRIPNGICLEGILETGQDCPDVSLMARTISGVEEVINHLVVRSSPSKG